MSGLRVSGPRLALRLATPADAPALFELGRDPEVSRFFSWGPYTDPAEPLAYIESLERQRASGERLELLIVDPGDSPIGITGLSDFSLRDRRAVIGTWLGRAHWGSGANRESKALILALAFRALDLVRVSALTDPANARSLVALERLGFTREGVLRGWHYHGSVLKDVVILGLLREEWERGELARVAVEIEGEPPPAYSQRK